MRILIIKLGAIGDVLRTTSILSGLEERYHPEVIDWITKPLAKEVLLNNPFINKIILLEDGGSVGPYGLVIALEDEFETCKLASRINPDKIIGAFLKDGKIAYTPSAWFDMSAISSYGIDKANALKKRNKKTFQQHMADLLGIKVGPYIFRLTAEEIEYGEKVVRGKGIGKSEKIIGINAGAGKRWPLKALSVEKSIDLVKKIKKDLGFASLILGGEEEKERNKIVAGETGMPDAGIHSLRNFSGIINRCNLVISSDSLAMHFAIALQKRLVVFFGPTSPDEIELYGLGKKVFAAKDCLVCYKRQCDQKPNCMDELSVDRLFEAVKKEAADI